MCVCVYGHFVRFTDIMALFGTRKVLREENSEENREEKWKENFLGGKYKISLNLIN